MSLKLNRRTALVGLATAAAILPIRFGLAAPLRIVVTKDPNCGCCVAWAEHLRENGFDVTLINNPQINRVKAKLGVPSALASCHTAETEGFVIEGHVPAEAIHRLLRERPKVRGLAVPGMPIGSPGMEVEGTPPETYSVIAFGPSGQFIFARYEGAKFLPVR
ncbi:DUF411 domain-containing protein [Pseudorhodoplanes sp.]|uniref:DUF411 domain-containing protein n=1 Tax=Pseudorhodoplanes sp. TaxID=1934341 RepID=UPI003D107408